MKDASLSMSDPCWCCKAPKKGKKGKKKSAAEIEAERLALEEQMRVEEEGTLMPCRSFFTIDRLHPRSKSHDVATTP